MKIQKKCENCKCIIIIEDGDVRQSESPYNEWCKKITRYTKCPICKEELVLYEYDKDIKEQK